jgi:hypothetical protein
MDIKKVLDSTYQTVASYLTYLKQKKIRSCECQIMISGGFRARRLLVPHTCLLLC